MHNTLENYYTVLFKMTNYRMSISEIENMIPYERDLYIELIKQEKEEKSKNTG